MEAGVPEKAAEAQSRALELNSQDADLWLDRGLSYAALKAWPRAISDFDRALGLQARRRRDPGAAGGRLAQCRQSGQGLEDASRALRIAPDHSEALLERGFASLARGDRGAANDDFSKVLRLVPPGSSAARGAEAGLRGEQPPAAAPVSPSTPAVPPKSGPKK